MFWVLKRTVLSYVFLGAQKNRLIEVDSFEHPHREIRKLFFDYALLSGGLLRSKRIDF